MSRIRKLSDSVLTIFNRMGIGVVCIIYFYLYISHFRAFKIRYLKTLTQVLSLLQSNILAQNLYIVTSSNHCHSLPVPHCPTHPLTCPQFPHQPFTYLTSQSLFNPCLFILVALFASCFVLLCLCVSYLYPYLPAHPAVCLPVPGSKLFYQ